MSLNIDKYLNTETALGTNIAGGADDGIFYLKTADYKDRLIMAQIMTRLKSIPVRITLIYAVVGALWILYSDRLLGSITQDPAVLTRFQTYKGFLFIFVTAVILFFLLSRNVAAIQRSEQILMDSEAKYRNLVENTSDWVWEINQDTEFTYTNPTIYDILGYRPEEIIGKTPYNFMTEDEKKRVLGLIGDTLARHEPVRLFENTLMNKNEYPVILEFSATAIYGPGGEFLGYRGIDRDVTERKRAEQAIRDRDLGIRRAYVDVFSAVTGGRLIIMTPDEIHGSLGEPVSDVGAVSSYKDLSGARAILNAALEKQFENKDILSELLISASEALTNAVKHAGGGEFQIFKKGQTIQVMASDTGPGIDFKILPKATLLAGFSTKQSLGVGFSIMLEFCDRVLLSTQPGNTIIVLEKHLIAPTGETEYMDT